MAGKEGTSCSLTNSWFQSEGATAKKTQLLVGDFLTYFGMATWRSIAYVDLEA